MTRARMASGDKKKLPDQEQRDKIRKLLDATMLVEAAAGTGKTTSMVGRMVELLRHDKCRVGQMAAVTFTRKAAAEMRGRFRIALEGAAASSSGEERERLLAGIGDIDRCFIGTIHSFCARLLRERPIEAGVDVSFREIEEDEDDQIREEAWQEYCARMLAESGGRMAELDRLGLRLSELGGSFLKYADYPDVDEWPLPHKQGEPDVGETVKKLRSYLEHMKELAEAFNVEGGKGDTLMPAYRNLPHMARLYGLGERNTNALIRLLVMMNKQAKVTPTKWMADKKQSQEMADRERQRWEGFRQEVTKPFLDAWYRLRYRLVMGLYEEAGEIYDSLRRERGVLNFQDLLMSASKLLADKVAVRKYFRKRFTHLLVDEFQDTDPIQAQVMLYLTAQDAAEPDWRKCRPKAGALFVVGDPKQSIYRFRRADIVTYDDVKGMIKAAKGEVVNLTANFRSVGKVIDWVNSSFEGRFPKGGSREAPEYVALTKGGNSEEEDVPGVQVLRPAEHPGDRNKIAAWEADVIARTIQGAIKGRMRVPRKKRELAKGVAEYAQPGDFMVITWKRERLDVYARRLEEYGIPCRVTGGTLLNEVRELRLLRDCLAALARPDNPVALVALLRGELFGFSDVSLYEFKKTKGRFDYNFTVPDGFAEFGDAFKRLRQYHAWTQKMPLVSALERICGELGLGALAATGERASTDAGSLAKALEVLRGRHEENWSLGSVVEQIDRIVTGEKEKHDGMEALAPERQAVRVMNLHQVKGLEAPIVFLADPTGAPKNEGRIRIHIDRSGDKTKGYMVIDSEKGAVALPQAWDELAERELAFLEAERTRLLYVAATRAGRMLVISQRLQLKGNNPWDTFSVDLEGREALADPGKAERGKGKRGTPVGDDEYMPALKQRQEALGLTAQDTYWAGGAKLHAMGGSKPDDYTGAADGEHGTEFGTAVHLLLQMAAEKKGSDLAAMAKGIVEDLDLDASLAAEVVKAANAVLGSTMWTRAGKVDSLMSETHFQVALEKDKKTVVVRGIVDLAFKERDSWVLVDYKTDKGEVGKLAAKYRPQLELYRKAWEQCTGEKVKELGFYFTAADEYRTVE